MIPLGGGGAFDVYVDVDRDKGGGRLGCLDHVKRNELVVGLASHENVKGEVFQLSGQLKILTQKVACLWRYQQE